MKIKVEHDLSTSDCGLIACTAAEGGIGYWSQIVDGYDYQRWWPDTRQGAGAGPIEVDEDFVFYTIRTDPDDDGSYSGDAREITPRVIARGIELFLGGDRRFEDVEFTMMDADEADTVIQLGLFGEVVYG